VRVRLAAVGALACALVFGLGTASADTTAQSLPFAQNWANTDLITANDDWSGVPGVVGHLGQDITTVTGTDPQTLLTESALPNDVDVIANQTSTGITNGGVAEFQLADPVVAIQGSGTADAPYLLLTVNTLGQSGVGVSYNLRDVDGTADNAVQQVALQYRVGSTGSFTNVPAGYVADATTGPSLATLVTPVSVVLPPAAADKAVLQVRIITTNAAGSDEWVGVDDISVVGLSEAAPFVSATDPGDDATDVPVASNIQITFSEPVNVSGSWFSISCSVSGAHAAGVSGGPTTFSLDPTADFAAGETCDVTVLAAQVADVDGDDPPDNMAADHSFSFTTAVPSDSPVLLAQDWSDTSLITANNNWSGVPGIIGYRGDGLAGTSGATDPQTVLVDGSATPVNVTANQTNPNTATSGGIAEFHLSNPVVAFQGSGTARAPHLVLSVDTTGREDIRVSYLLRDVDGATDDTTQPVALQYRVGGSGAYTNVPGAFVADASTGPNLAVRVTPIRASLPAATEDQSLVQIRIITTDSLGSDEWIGIDDIVVSSGPPPDLAPSVVTTSPLAGATDVPTAAPVYVSFSEAVAVAGDWYTITCASSGAHAATVTGGPATYALTPTTPFAKGEACTVTIHASGVVDLDGTPDHMASDHAFGFTTVPPPTIIPIGSVQGSVPDTVDGTQHVSPRSGQTVSVQGVVYQRTLTQSSQHGFFVQNTAATADADPNSSDGIFVFTGSSAALGGYVPQIGDEIVVTGVVSEFFSLTQLESVTLEEIVRSGVLLDVELPAVQADPDADLAAANRQWERLEGMRVQVPAGSVALNGRDVFAGPDSEIWVARADSEIAERSDPYARRAFRDPHPLDNNPGVLFDDGNGYRIMMGSFGIKASAGDRLAVLAPARTFATLENAPVGGVSFSFGKYAVMVAQQPQWTLGVDPSLNSPPPAFDRSLAYSVANYNVENLYDFHNDPFDGCDFATDAGCTGVSPPFDYVPPSNAVYQARLRLIARQIVEDLHAPDIVLTQEAEDQDVCTIAAGGLVCGNTNDADGQPDTLQELTLAIQEVGGPQYEARLDRDGADDRGIVSGFLFRTDRVELLPAAGPLLGADPQIDYRGTPLAHNADVQNPKALNADLPDDVDRSTGVDGTNVYTRAPQVGLFRVWRSGIGLGTSVDLYAVSNHFSSGPDRRVGQRREQAAYNAAIAAAADRPHVLLGGDFNVFPRPDDPFSPGHPLFPTDQLGPIYEEGLENLWDTMVAQVPAAAYGYVFQGQAQTLDMQFVTATLKGELRHARVAHVNADWPAEHDGDGPRGLSDHDPMLSRYVIATSLEQIAQLVETYAGQGRIRGQNTTRILLDRLERARRLRDGGHLGAYADQLRAFAAQVQDLAPRFIDQEIADALADEATALLDQ
jgi:uncharacterized protein